MRKLWIVSVPEGGNLKQGRNLDAGAARPRPGNQSRNRTASKRSEAAGRELHRRDRNHIQMLQAAEGKRERWPDQPRCEAGPFAFRMQSFLEPVRPTESNLKPGRPFAKVKLLKRNSCCRPAAPCAKQRRGTALSRPMPLRLCLLVCTTNERLWATASSRVPQRTNPA